MKQSKICEVFSIFANIPTDEAVKYMPLISATQKNVENSLKDSSYADEFSYELELLCGAKVFYDYLLSRASVDTADSSTVKIGGVSTTVNKKLSENVTYAKELYTKYQLLSANLFCDNEFTFRGV